MQPQNIIIAILIPFVLSAPLAKPEPTTDLNTRQLPSLSALQLSQLCSGVTTSLPPPLNTLGAIPASVLCTILGGSPTSALSGVTGAAGGLGALTGGLGGLGGTKRETRSLNLAMKQQQQPNIVLKSRQTSQQVQDQITKYCASAAAITAANSFLPTQAIALVISEFAMICSMLKTVAAQAGGAGTGTAGTGTAGGLLGGLTGGVGGATGGQGGGLGALTGALGGLGGT